MVIWTWYHTDIYTYIYIYVNNIYFWWIKHDILTYTLQNRNSPLLRNSLGLIHVWLCNKSQVLFPWSYYIDTYVKLCECVSIFYIHLGVMIYTWYDYWRKIAIYQELCRNHLGFCESRASLLSMVNQVGQHIFLFRWNCHLLWSGGRPHFQIHPHHKLDSDKNGVIWYNDNDHDHDHDIEDDDKISHTITIWCQYSSCYSI